MNLYIAILMTCILIACNRGELNIQSGDIVEHPIEENIPHYDRDHLKINRGSSFEEFTEKPVVLDQMQRFLRDSEQFDLIDLGLFVSGARAVDIISFSSDQNQLVILDKRANKLFQYDIQSGNSIDIAPQGSGPGDIAYPMEMVKHQNSFFILMEDMRISRFNCNSSPCVYERTIPLDFSPFSLAVADDHYAVFGQTPFRGEEEFEFDKHVVRLIDENGEIQASFGATYETEHWIVLFTIRDGHLRYNPARKEYIKAIDLLPLIYIYNEDLELTNTYNLSEFVQGKVRYNRIMRSASPPSGAFSSINSLSIVDEHLVLVATNTISDEGFSNDVIHPNRQDYYVIDLSEEKGYHLGSMYTHTFALIHVLDNSLVLSNNGVLYRIQELK